MSRSRPLLWSLSLLVVAAACIPAAYLVIRAREAPASAWNLLLTERTALLLGNTLLLAAVVTLLSAALALPLAWLTVRAQLPWPRLWSMLLSLPLAVPSFIFGYVLLAAFGTGGLLEQWGLLTLDIYGFWGAVLALTLSTIPFPFLSFRAALLREDPALLEAAASLGASPRAAFVRVTLPRLVHALRSSGLLVAFYCLSDFGAVSLLQYDTFSRAIFMQLEGAFDRSLAALWSVVLMLLAASVLVMSEYRAGLPPPVSSGRASRAQRRIDLGAWAWLAVCGCGAVVLLGVGLPLFVIGYWMTQVDSADLAPALLQPTYHSLLAAVLAALATVVVALPLGLLGARMSSVAARAMVRSAYAAYALPPIVVALSLVSFGANVVPLVYGTLGLLVFAHVVRFLPQALGPVQGAFADVSPRLFEAGTNLGAPPPSVAATVMFPLVRPGLVAGATLVFLTTMKELPATLLLAPIGFQTLSTRIWSATAEGQFALGALPAFLLVGLSSLSVAWTLKQEHAPAALSHPVTEPTPENSTAWQQPA